jgi:flagellar protein FlaG
MNITVIGQNPATEGRAVFTPGIIGTRQAKKPEENAKQVETVVEDVSKIKADVQQLQDISDILGRKLLFNVNEQLDKVVVKVVDPSTDKVIKEIPSAEVQQMQIRIREALGFLFDEKI